MLERSVCCRRFLQYLEQDGNGTAIALATECDGRHAGEARIRHFLPHAASLQNLDERLDAAWVSKMLKAAYGKHSRLPASMLDDLKERHCRSRIRAAFEIDCSRPA